MRRRTHAQDVSAIADVATAARLIGANEVSADEDVVLLGHERLLVRTQPIGQRFGCAQDRLSRSIKNPK